MSDDRNITAFLGGVRRLLRYLKPGAPLRRAEIFLVVAEGEPITLAEVSRITGVPPATAYDDLRALGKVDANGKTGARLVNEIPGGPREPAHRFLLSVRGRQAVAAVEFEMGAVLQAPEEEDDEPLREYFAAIGPRRTRG